MSKLSLCLIVLILVSSAFQIAPTIYADSVNGYFTPVQVYWGTNQQTEVSPGDVSTLKVILRYEGVTLKNFEAYLSLPSGFEAVGGGNTVFFYYSGTLPKGSIVELNFPIFLKPDLEIGNYASEIAFECYNANEYYYSPFFDYLTVILKVTGKPNVKVKAMNSSLHEGNQQVLIELFNGGNAIAKNLRIIKAYSSSVSVELDTIELLGNLGPRENTTVLLSIFVPKGLDGKTTSLTVEGSYLGPTNIGYSFLEALQLPVTVAEPIKITTQFPEMYATPGETVQFKIRLENNLDIETRLTLSAEAIPQNWKVFIRSSTRDLVRDVILDSNAFVDLLVEVTSPDSATTEEEYKLSVKAESVGQNMTCFFPVTVILTEAEEEISVATKFPDVTVQAGKIVQYSVTVTNLGDTDRLLLLLIDHPADWKAVFKSGALEVSSLYLEAGKSENLVIEVTPPSIVSIDTYRIPVQVKSENGAVHTETQLTATIIGSYDLALEPSTLLASTTAGSSISLTAKVTNEGLSSVTGVGLEIDAPTDWDVSINPIQVDMLKSKESFSFSLVVETPQNTVAGDYMITIIGFSDQLESNQVQVRTTVGATTSWAIYGLGLAAVFVVALVLIFRKFRRR